MVRPAPVVVVRRGHDTAAHVRALVLEKRVCRSCTTHHLLLIEALTLIRAEAAGVVRSQSTVTVERSPELILSSRNLLQQHRRVVLLRTVGLLMLAEKMMVASLRAAKVIWADRVKKLRRHIHFIQLLRVAVNSDFLVAIIALLDRKADAGSFWLGVALRVQKDGDCVLLQVARIVTLHRKLVHPVEGGGLRVSEDSLLDGLATR